MTNEKRKYCMETIIPELRNAGVTLEQLSKNLIIEIEMGSQKQERDGMMICISILLKN